MEVGSISLPLSKAWSVLLVPALSNRKLQLRFPVLPVYCLSVPNDQKRPRKGRSLSDSF